MRNTIKIAGAGISGLTCAINLGRAGYKVKIFEKSKEVGSRFNNDFQGLENWSSEEEVLSLLKRINVTTEFYWKGFKEADLINDLSNHFKIRSPSDRHAIYMIKRGTEVDSLDQHLKKQALELGIEIEFNSKMEEEEVDIVATGPRFVSGIVYGLKGSVMSEDKIVIMMDNSCAPKGYVYMAILDGRVTLASVMMGEFKRAKKCLQEAKEKLNRLYHLDIKNIQYFGGFGSFFLKETYSHGNRLYVGESAGLQDYLFGFGMRYAFISGYLASQSILNNINYDQLLKHELLDILKSSLVNRYQYEKLGNKGYRRLIKRWSRSLDPLVYLRTWYNLTWIKKCIYPVSTTWFRKKMARLSSSNVMNEIDF